MNSSFVVSFGDANGKDRLKASAPALVIPNVAALVL
jgi:hypothetical protein